MRKNKIALSNKLIIILIGLLIVVGLFIYNFIKEANTYSNIIKSNWKIELSSSYKEIYSSDSGPSFLGDGYRYHIFEYKTSSDIKDSLDWQTYKNPSMELDINTILSELKVQNEYLPPFDLEYKHFFKFKDDSSKLYIIFNEKENKVYVAEHFL
ncbi:MAG: hypothetical protein KIB43_14045 [Clostridium baratii]|uniref:Uncharacterized protein n=1 Tax=Clostridium baratii str. Sullivan TaxID=1415775 RepID=A0A0A7G0F6_9CLOT|nr:hypothetical protein [Clostridium baratii]AIY84675.1 hypothetical protein U729_955 [Clostridium baratii str. Sullivan]MBS6008052.1 hypothetical protein [Clostridium baratii]MDU1055014.1 hypothetical protein [Clostridium baratii]MDU4912253.1 hypothetical protein [Clostridium baratii]CUP77661.1 Uncharacterised protein [Clostridium baratii]